MDIQLIEHDFLSQAHDEAVRKEATNILSSYNQVYDVLAEILQNAVDAVDERYNQESATAVTKIAISFNAHERSITITDTGTGMPWGILKQALAPNISYKASVSAKSLAKRSRGEKGVGLSFLTFVCNYLRVKTCDGTQTIEAVVKGANDWVDERSQIRPMIKPTSANPEPVTEELGSRTYTQIELKDVKTKDYCDQDIFDMVLPELVYTLRTKTAVGFTGSITSNEVPEPDIEISLLFTDKENNEHAEQRVPYRYLAPEEYVDSGSKVSYDRFIELLRDDKLNQVRGKALIYRSQKKTEGGRLIDCYAFAMAAEVYKDIQKDLIQKEGWIPDSWTGIYIATRGMPSGITVEHPVTYDAGYWRRVFMLLQDDQMKFDVGRKSLVGQAKPMMQSIAEQVWKEISPYLQRITPGDSEAVTRRKQGKLIQLFQEAQGWPNLNFDKVQYLKQPQREQMVVALFYELIGAGVLKGYKTLRNNTFDQYDAFVQYTIAKKEIGQVEAASIKENIINDLIIIEFKHGADDILVS